IGRALVELGGDVVVSGAPPGTNGWTIRVPNAGDDSLAPDLALADRAISTSGDTEQFVELGGRRYSHIIDPRTGQALTNRVQVTLIAANGLTSDPLTKTLCVLGGAAGSRVLKAYPEVKAYVRTLPNTAGAALGDPDQEGWKSLFDGQFLRKWKRTE